MYSFIFMNVIGQLCFYVYVKLFMLRTFSSRDKLTMLSLFKALVMSRLGYGCQFSSGMEGLSYPERLTVLKLYSLHRRRERYIIIYVWKILEGLVPNLFPLICTKTLRPVSRHTLMLDDWEHWSIIALDGVPSVCLTNYLCLYIIPLYVLFIVSRNNWIATYLQHGVCLAVAHSPVAIGNFGGLLDGISNKIDNIMVVK